MNHLLFLALFLLKQVYASEPSFSLLTFELAETENVCYFEHIQDGDECEIKYRVLRGGNLDVDMEILAPGGQRLNAWLRSEGTSYTWRSTVAGEYSFCFSNQFSSYTPKTIFFYLSISDEAEGRGDSSLDATARTEAVDEMSKSIRTKYERLERVLDLQRDHIQRQWISRSTAEDLNARVHVWSAGQTVVMVTVAVVQVLIFRRFFMGEKHQRKTSTRT